MFVGCQPCSLFDAGVRPDDSDELDEPTNDTAVTSAQKTRKVGDDTTMGESKMVKGNHDGDAVMSIDITEKRGFTPNAASLA